MSGPIFSSSYHAKGQTSPDRRPPRITSAKPKPTKQPGNHINLKIWKEKEEVAEMTFSKRFPFRNICFFAMEVLSWRHNLEGIDDDAFAST